MRSHGNGSIGLDVMPAESVLNKLGSFAEVHFIHHVCAVALDRPNADTEQVADFFVRFAFGN